MFNGLTIKKRGGWLNTEELKDIVTIFILENVDMFWVLDYYGAVVSLQHSSKELRLFPLYGIPS